MNVTASRLCFNSWIILNYLLLIQCGDANYNYEVTHFHFHEALVLLNRCIRFLLHNSARVQCDMFAKVMSFVVRSLV
jgi:hypothetical protein